jgi:hypothetical protein
MAQTQTLNQPPAAAPPPSEPLTEAPRRGRPPKSAQGSQAEPLTATAQSSAEAEKQGFFQRLRSASPVDWERYIVYLYRTDPIVDTTAGGTKPKYVAKFTQPFDEDTVMKEFGSGGYRADWNERVGTKERTVQQFHFPIENPNHPPRLQRGSWLDDPRNNKWKGWFPPEAQPAAPTPAQGMNMSEALAFARQLIQEVRPDASAPAQNVMVTAVLDAIKETRRELADQSKPVNWGSVITAAMPLILAFINKGSSSDTVLQAIQQQNALLLKAIERRTSPFGDLKEMVQTMSLMRTEFGGGGSGDWLSTLGPTIGPMLAQMMMSRGQGMPPGAPQLPQMPIPQMPFPPAANPQASQEPAADMSQQQAFPTEQVEWIQELVMGNAITMYKFFDTERSGLDYADYFVEGNGRAAWEMLTLFGFENLIKLIQGNALAWGKIAPRQLQFQAFMNDFYSWTPKEPDPEPEPGLQ